MTIWDLNCDSAAFSHPALGLQKASSAPSASTQT